MNTHKTNTALNAATSTPRIDLDELLRRAFDGDRDALGAAFRELREQLVDEASEQLGDLESEAEDVVQDLFLAVLEGRIRAPRRPGEERKHLRRILRVLVHRRRARGPTLPHDLE